MSSPAKLPSSDIRDKLEDVLDLLDDARTLLRELEQDETWWIWNEGGRPFGRPDRNGPGYYSAHQFTALADHLYGRLDAVGESFVHRQKKERERAKKKKERERTLRRMRAVGERVDA